MQHLRQQRLGALAGLGFCGIVIATIVLSVGGPSPGDTAATIRAYFADPGNRQQLEAAGFLYGVAAFLFVAWLSALCGRLGRGQDGAASLVLGLGVAVIALECVSAACVTAYPLALDTFDAARSDVQLALTTQAVSYASASFAGILTAAMAVVTGASARASGALPRWAAWVSFASAPLALVAALMFFAPAVLLLWVLALSVAMAAGEPRERAVPATA